LRILLLSCPPEFADNLKQDGYQIQSEQLNDYDSLSALYHYNNAIPAYEYDLIVCSPYGKFSSEQIKATGEPAKQLSSAVEKGETIVIVFLNRIDCEMGPPPSIEHVVNCCQTSRPIYSESDIRENERYAIENRKPLVQHVEDYVGHCRKTGQADRSVKGKVLHLNRLIKWTGMARLSDFTADALENHMKAMQESGLSARTINFTREISHAFINWGKRTGRLESNPLSVVGKLDERKDRRRIRRPLTDDELARLLDTVEPFGRKAWYMTAALAGLRKGDMQRLIWADIDFQVNTITIREGKSGRIDIIPMHPQLAEELKKRKDESRALPKAKVFQTTVTDLTRRKDFLRAGLAREEVVTDENGELIMIGKRNPKPKTRIVTYDDEGREIDLHALRTTLGTNLARAGVAPQLAQKVMRHADYRTTLKHYTVLGVADTSKAINQLPPIESKQREAATGTCDINPETYPPLKPQLKRHETEQIGAIRCEGGKGENPNADDCKHFGTTTLSDKLQGNAKQSGTAPGVTRTRDLRFRKPSLYPG